MKKFISVALLTVLTASFLTACGHSEYCSVSGCPKESARGADYCYEHKCSNTSCSNKAINSYSYCKKCIERAK